MLIAHCQQDLFVPYEQGALLYRAVRRARGDAVLFTLPDAPHGFVGDPNGLSAPAVTAGSTPEATSHCFASRPVPLTPSWGLIAGWLRLALDDRR